MKLLSEIAESEVVVAFLRAELSSSRYGKYLKLILLRRGQGRSLIDAPNLASGSGSEVRRSILDEVSPHCGGIWSDDERIANIRASASVPPLYGWEPTAESPDAGFYLNEFMDKISNHKEVMTKDIDQDAMALAELIYDVYMQEEPDRLAGGQNNEANYSHNE